MTYEGDPILPLAQKTVKAKVAEFKNLTDEEQLAMVSLSEAQLGALRNADEAAKREFLEEKPKLDQITMSHEKVVPMMENWGH